MKYDDAGWHYGGDFPTDLPQEAGATHIGMFLAWCLLNGLGSRYHKAGIERLRRRESTPGQYFITECDEKLTDEDLNREGNAFACAYYDYDSDSFSFISDYSAAFASDRALPSIYHIADSWETYEKVAPYVVSTYELWKSRTPVIASPAEQFYSLCGEVAEKLKPFGYRYAKSGPHVSRRQGGFSYKIHFFQNESFRSICLAPSIASRKFKTWQIAHGVPNANGRLHAGGLSAMLGLKKQHSGWAVKESGVADIIAGTVQEFVEPFFTRFQNIEKLIPDVVTLRFPYWERINAIQFILCFGEHEQARQAAVNFLQERIGMYYEYEAWFRSYRGEGLSLGGGYAKRLAQASHLFGFGDLTKDVTLQ